MSNMEINKTASEILKQRRQNALTNAEINLDDLCEKDASFKAAYTFLKEAELNLVKANHAKLDTTEAKNHLISAKNLLTAVYEKNNLPKDFTEPKFVCEKCGDTGIINGKDCSCKKELLINLTFKNRQRTTTGNFALNTETNSENLAVIKEAKLWCEKFPSVKKINYLLCGHTGVGKTFLADCICAELLKKSMQVVYLTSYQLSQAIKDDVFSNDKTDVLQRLSSCEVLIIDDLGKEPIFKKIYLESLFCLLNERQLNRLSTIVTTNLFGEQLIERYGEGIFARLANKQNTMVRKLVGNDKRTVFATNNPA